MTISMSENPSKSIENGLRTCQFQVFLNYGLRTKIVKFLNQCFAQFQYPKSVCTAGTVGFVNSRHFLDIEVVQNTDLKI